jgi:glycine/D-amino acid oxidase-like deaminating enzyme
LSTSPDPSQPRLTDHRPWWLADQTNPLPHAPSLDGKVTADVCVVGGGFAGLWTAIHLRRTLGDARVVLVERDHCGSGASGRNGGWATTWYLRIDKLVDRFGDDLAVQLADASCAAIDDIENFAAEWDFDCEFRRAGSVWSATAPAHMNKWDTAVSHCRRLGRADKLTPASGEALREEIGSPLILGGVREPDSAAVHPGKLVTGLVHAARSLGVEIFEGTPAQLAEGAAGKIVTPRGSVSADRIVITTGAWAAQHPRARRMVLPVATSVLVTEPIPDRLKDLAWSAGTLVKDSRLSLHFMHVTGSGRIVFGSGGGAVATAGRVGPRQLHDPPGQQAARDDFRRWFPQLQDVAISHVWSGPVDFSPGGLPFVGALEGREDVLFGFGFSGNGVAPSALIGRTLADEIAGCADPAVRDALAPPPSGYFFPEPLRSLGGRIVRQAVIRCERAEENGRRPPGAKLLKRIPDWTVPRFLERRSLRAPGPPRAAGP